MRQLAELFRVAARSNVRKFSTSQLTESTGSSSALPKSMIQVPAWWLVGLGAAAAGFFGKVLHDDNLATRRELQETRQGLETKIEARSSELRADNKELRADNKELRIEMKAGFTKIEEAISTLRPGQK